MFVRAGDNLNAVDKNGMTPLHHAATVNNNTITNLLLAEPKVDVTLSDKYGSTVLHYLAVAMVSKHRQDRCVDDSFYSVPSVNIQKYHDIYENLFLYSPGYSTLDKQLVNRWFKKKDEKTRSRSLSID